MRLDFRSDTVTRPTPAMRRAMAEAEVGDDVLEEDTTVQRLEARVAELLGKEAGLFVTSGTMANQIAIRCLTEPGDELILEADAHPFHYEAGAVAVISGVTIRLVPGEDGFLTPALLRAAVRGPNVHHAPPRLLSVENTANRGGGKILSVEKTAALVENAKSLSLSTHLDGARIWNAAAATGRSEAEFARGFDMVSVCFSKGLGAPVGSLIAGTKAQIHKARRVRKMLGGGMRQVGILAAGALHAVEHHRERLQEDHDRALQLYEGLQSIGWACERPQTNMVYVETPGATEVAARLNEAGVLCFSLSPTRIRLVTHLDVGDPEVDGALEVFKRLR